MQKKSQDFKLVAPQISNSASVTVYIKLINKNIWSPKGSMTYSAHNQHERSNNLPKKTNKINFEKNKIMMLTLIKKQREISPTFLRRLSQHQTISQHLAESLRPSRGDELPCPKTSWAQWQIRKFNLNPRLIWEFTITSQNSTRKTAPS